MASNGVFFNAQIPMALRKITIRKMRNLFRALASMILSIINFVRIVYGFWLVARSQRCLYRYANGHKLRAAPASWQQR